MYSAAEGLGRIFLAVSMCIFLCKHEHTHVEIMVLTTRVRVLGHQSFASGLRQDLSRVIASPQDRGAGMLQL
jgi:hypothetical protein